MRPLSLNSVIFAIYLILPLLTKPKLGYCHKSEKKNHFKAVPIMPPQATLPVIAAFGCGQDASGGRESRKICPASSQLPTGEKGLDPLSSSGMDPENRIQRRCVTSKHLSLT